MLVPSHHQQSHSSGSVYNSRKNPVGLPHTEQSALHHPQTKAKFTACSLRVP